MQLVNFSVDLSSWKSRLEVAASEFRVQEADAAAGPSNRQFFGYKNNRDRKKERKERRKVQFDESDDDCSDYSEEEGDVDAGDPVKEHDDGHVEEHDEMRAENAGPSNPKVFTIGTIGYPNVGKSSLINAIMGRNVSLLQFTTNLLKCFQYFNDRIRL